MKEKKIVQIYMENSIAPLNKFEDFSLPSFIRYMNLKIWRIHQLHLEINLKIFFAFIDSHSIQIGLSSLLIDSFFFFCFPSFFWWMRQK